ncbi:MAG: RNA polymerase sigma factor [Planctomycetota bacterium]|nr:sigma-70 family RNA polymerase sigma factor [Planctomycetota bacterium]
MSERQEAKDWVVRVQNGDMESLQSLYDLYTPLMFSVARRILRRTQDAEVVVQQTWVEAYRSLGDYDPLGSVAGWLLEMVRTRALDQRGSWDEDVAREPDTGVDPQEVKLWKKALKVLEGLEGDEREILELAYFEGQSASVIAKTLGQSVESVKASMQSGLDRLKVSEGTLR